MKIVVQVTESIQVRIAPQPKKKKTSKTNYDIYLRFSVTQHGITQKTVDISAGISVPISEWTTSGAKGRSDRSKLVNTQLNTYVATAKHHLEQLKLRPTVTSVVVAEEIHTAVKPAITGKAPRGKKTDLTRQFRHWTVDGVLEDLVRVKKPSIERQRIYKHALAILHRFYDGATPLITEITETQLREFKVWYRDNFRLTAGPRKGESPANDSTVTWFTMISAVFVHAYKRMKILKSLPLPEGFRGAFADVEREVLTEAECLKLIALDDAQLNHAKQVAKHCLVLQLTTGMGLGDLRTLTREHVKYDGDQEGWYILKNRQKTDKPFRQFFTPRAKASYDRLRELSGGINTLFDLTCTNNLNGHYKDLAAMAGICKRVTSYILRHSFAVDFMDRDGTLEDLSVVLGNDIRNAKKYGRISQRRLAGKSIALTALSPMHQV